MILVSRGQFKRIVELRPIDFLSFFFNTEAVEGTRIVLGSESMYNSWRENV